MTQIKIPSAKTRKSRGLAAAAVFAAFSLGFAGANLLSPPSFSPPTSMGGNPQVVDSGAIPKAGLDSQNLPPLDLSGTVDKVTPSGFTLKTASGLELEVIIPNKDITVGDSVSIIPKE